MELQYHKLWFSVGLVLTNAFPGALCRALVEMRPQACSLGLVACAAEANLYSPKQHQTPPPVLGIQCGFLRGKGVLPHHEEAGWQSEISRGECEVPIAPQTHNQPHIYLLQGPSRILCLSPPKISTQPTAGGQDGGDYKARHWLNCLTVRSQLIPTSSVCPCLCSPSSFPCCVTRG